METLKNKIVKQAKIYEDYQGNESAILSAEKSGKFHGFIAGAEWATAQLKADKEELLSMLGKAYEYLEEIGMVVPNKEWTEQFRDRWNGKLNEVDSLIQKHKQCEIK